MPGGKIEIEIGDNFSIRMTGGVMARKCSSRRLWLELICRAKDVKKVCSLFSC
jgi:hypothetical protein